MSHPFPVKAENTSFGRAKETSYKPPSVTGGGFGSNATTGGGSKGRRVPGGDWGNESLDTGTLKKPAFTLGKKTESSAFPEKKAEEPKPVTSEFKFIKDKQEAKQKEEQKKKEELSVELLEIIDSDALSDDA